MVPGGWNGTTTTGTVMHLIEKVQNSSSEATYAFVTCNSGEGLEYHPSAPDSNLTSGKVKYKTCLRISGIPLEKIPVFSTKVQIDNDLLILTVHGNLAFDAAPYILLTHGGNDHFTFTQPAIVE